MLRNVGLSMALGAAVFGCGDSGVTPPCQDACPPVKPAVTSLSPNQAFALSPEIRLIITGSSFQGSTHQRSRVVWCVGSDTTVLPSTFVSDSVLEAELSPNLLRDAADASVVVQNILLEDSTRMAQSSAWSFVVLPRDSLFSVAPASTTAGGPDITITVQGRNFLDNGLHDRSFVVLSVNGMDTWLATTFISSSELTAVIPAPLLAEPIVGVVSVWTGDVTGDCCWSETGAAKFTVTP